jgi:HK97 family phage portal protein
VSILAKAFVRPRNAAPVPYAPRSTGNSPLSGLFGGGRGSTGPSEDQLRSVMTSGTLFAIIDALSTAVAEPDWDLYRKPTNGKLQDDERESVPKHAARDIWERPNPFMTGSFLRELVQQHVDLTGEGAIIVAKAGTLPIELWPVRPDKLTPVPHPTKFLAGWIYLDPDGEKIPFKVDEVLHLRKPSAIDPYRGASAVDAISTDLQAADFAAQWNRNFFLNSAEPGGVIEVEHRMSDDQFDEMVMRWNEQHKGVQRAHRVAVIEQGKYVPRAFSQRDMQFMELRAAGRDTIMEAFRVSKTALGITDDVNRASALASEYQFSSKLTVPRLNRWRDMLNWQFLPMFGSTGSGVEFDYDSPVQADAEIDALDRTSKVNAAVAIMGIPGVKFDVNDVFAAYGLPEIDFEEVEIPVPGAAVDEDGNPLPPGEQAPPGQQPGGQPPTKGDEEKPAQGPTNRTYPRADWDEGKHPRDPDGKFRRWGGAELLADYRERMTGYTSIERRSLSEYTGNNFRMVNEWLRGNQYYPPRDPDSMFAEDAGAEVQQLSSLAARYRSTSPVDVRRFVRAEAIPEGLQPGDIFVDHAFSSTTVNSDPPADFRAMPVRMEIDVPAGSNMIVVNGVGDRAGVGIDQESEVILPAGTRYQVIGDETDANGKRVLHMKALAPDDPPQVLGEG